jgi:hypothetical protein
MAVMFPDDRFTRASSARHLTTMESVLARVVDDSGAVLIPERRSSPGRGLDC